MPPPMMPPSHGTGSVPQTPVTPNHASLPGSGQSQPPQQISMAHAMNPQLSGNTMNGMNGSMVNQGQMGGMGPIGGVPNAQQLAMMQAQAVSRGQLQNQRSNSMSGGSVNGMVPTQPGVPSHGMTAQPIPGAPTPEQVITNMNPRQQAQFAGLPPQQQQQYILRMQMQTLTMKQETANPTMTAPGVMHIPGALDSATSGGSVMMGPPPAPPGVVAPAIMGMQIPPSIPPPVSIPQQPPQTPHSQATFGPGRPFPPGTTPNAQPHMPMHPQQPIPPQPPLLPQVGGDLPIMNAMPPPSHPTHQPQQPTKPALPQHLIGKVDPRITVVTPLPYVTSEDDITHGGALPPIQEFDIKKIQGWMSKDKAYAALMDDPDRKQRHALEVKEAQGKTKWWEMDDYDRQRGPVYPNSKVAIEFPAQTRKKRELRRGVNRRECTFPKDYKGDEVNKLEQLVPIRIEVEYENYRIRDAFVWNLNGASPLFYGFLRSGS